MDMDIHNLSLMDMNINNQNMVMDMVMEGELIMHEDIHRMPDIMELYLSIYYLYQCSYNVRYFKSLLTSFQCKFLEINFNIKAHII